MYIDPSSSWRGPFQRKGTYNYSFFLIQFPHHNSSYGTTTDTTGVSDGAVAADPGRGVDHRLGHLDAVRSQRRVPSQHRRGGESLCSCSLSDYYYWLY